MTSPLIRAHSKPTPLGRERLPNSSPLSISLVFREIPLPLPSCYLVRTTLADPPPSRHPSSTPKETISDHWLRLLLVSSYGFETIALKQHFGKKLMELEDEKRSVQLERDWLLAEVESLADGHLHKFPDIHSLKLKSLEAQVLAE
ncbi:hypothetical protein KFK09_001551 [Dendrobium nobile]|uniref:Uncharacterized protein n=1 Tax=Dendrobium nobile TaxID=94219 RepID=A0A8T3C560_DENNO|nr:hypothetical protein KFK09_001551 [Dendrobium nobile]